MNLSTSWDELKGFLEQSLPEGSRLVDATELVGDTPCQLGSYLFGLGGGASWALLTVGKLRIIYQEMFGAFEGVGADELKKSDFNKLSILEGGVLKKYLAIMEKSNVTPSPGLLLFFSSFVVVIVLVLVIILVIGIAFIYCCCSSFIIIVIVIVMVFIIVVIVLVIVIMIVRMLCLGFSMGRMNTKFIGPPNNMVI